MAEIIQRETLHVVTHEQKFFGVIRRLPSIDWAKELTLDCDVFGHVLESDGKIINCMICRTKWKYNGMEYEILPK